MYKKSRKVSNELLVSDTDSVTSDTDCVGLITGWCGNCRPGPPRASSMSMAQQRPWELSKSPPSWGSPPHQVRGAEEMTWDNSSIFFQPRPSLLAGFPTLAWVPWISSAVSSHSLPEDRCCAVVTVRGRRRCPRRC